jgi:hypothetical protein
MIKSLPADESDSSDSSSSDDESKRATNFASNSKPQQCTGMNKRRKQCGVTALPGSKFCHAHAPPKVTHADILEESRASATAIAGKYSLETTVARASDAGSPSTHLENESLQSQNFGSVQRLWKTISNSLINEVASEQVPTKDAEDDDVEIAVCMAPSDLVDTVDAPGYDNRDEVSSVNLNVSNPDPQHWTWDMSLRERWEACEDFMQAHEKELESILQQIKIQFRSNRINTTTLGCKRMLKHMKARM